MDDFFAVHDQLDAGRPFLIFANLLDYLNDAHAIVFLYNELQM
jgi:hypothetical protein